MANSVTRVSYRDNCISTYPSAECWQCSPNCASHEMSRVRAVSSCCWGHSTHNITLRLAKLLQHFQTKILYSFYYPFCSCFTFPNTCITAQIINKHLSSTINASYVYSEGSQSNLGRHCYPKRSFLWCSSVPYENTKTAS
jgi:hypothetical protein